MYSYIVFTMHNIISGLLCIPDLFFHAVIEYKSLAIDYCGKKKKLCFYYNENKIEKILIKLLGIIKIFTDRYPS